MLGKTIWVVLWVLSIAGDILLMTHAGSGWPVFLLPFFVIVLAGPVMLSIWDYDKK